jgi:hypothetical protein
MGFIEILMSMTFEPDRFPERKSKGGLEGRQQARCKQIRGQGRLVSHLSSYRSAT